MRLGSFPLHPINPLATLPIANKPFTFALAEIARTQKYLGGFPQIAQIVDVSRQTTTTRYEGSVEEWTLELNFQERVWVP